MSRARCAVLAALVLILPLLFPNTVRAQSQATTGVIEGTVQYEKGPLPGVAVAVRNTATNFEQTVATDKEGRFRAVLLPLGPYRVTATLEGFATLVRDGIQLSVGQSVNLQLTLQVSKVEQQIVVTAEAPVIETARTEGSVKLDQAAIQGLPNNGRNFLDLVKLTPGVTIVQGPDGDEVSINGQKGIQNNISVDGADFNNPFFGEQRGGQRPAFTFNLDAVEDVVVVADGAPAEFGRSSSGFVNVVTKSGTNQLHGSAHAYFKNDSLSSRAQRADGSVAPASDSRQAQAGATLGGPIQPDHLFYFVALDTQDAQATKQTDPSRIEQRVVDALAALGSPNENGPIERTNNARVLLGKLDWQPTERHLWTLRYNYTWSEQKNGTFDVDSWGRSANAIEKDKSNAGSGSVLSTFASDLLNELRFQYAREDRPRPYNGPLIAGQDRPLPDTAFDFARGYRFGEPFFIPVKYYDTRAQVNDNVSYLKGAHSWKGGVEYNRVDSVQTFVGFANGRYIFSSTDGFLNYLKNPKYVECSDGSSSQTGVCPPGTSITGPVLLFLQQAGVGGLTAEQAGTQSIVQKEPAVFLQDTWQPRANLTIQYGLRWEAEIEPDPITPASQVFYAGLIGKTVNGQTFPSNGKIPSDNAMWQPRLGISWDPRQNGKTVVRGNAGIFYARVPGLVLASSRSTNGSLGQTLFRNSALTPFLGPVPAYPNLIPASQVGSPDHPDVFVFDRNFENPRTMAVGLGVEQELAPGLAGVLKFNYAKGEHQTRFVNRNDPLLGSPWSSGLGPDGKNGVGVLTTVESTGRSQYNGWTIGLNKLGGQVLEFQAYYTYSKDKSNDDNERDPFTFRYAKVTDLAAEWGYSDRDQRHRFNGWVLWHAPQKLEVNLRYTYRSSQPKSITLTGADANTPQDRINPDGSVTERNLGRKHNLFSSIDLRISRLFHVGGLEIEGILDAFNLANSKNLRSPEVTNLIFNFDGTVQSGTGDPRQVQLGVRVRW
jgi:carboxypeptidase family protein/TonB-dependent receptor-like protein